MSRINSSRLMQIAILFVLAIFLWSAADGQGALTLLRDANLYWLFLAILLLTAQTLLSARRWRVTARQIGLTLSAHEALREYYLAQVVNQTLPGGVVGDAGRIVRARHRAGLVVSGQAVVFERFSGQIGLLVVMLAGLLITLLTPGTILWPDWLQRYATLVLALFLIVPLIVFNTSKMFGNRAVALRRFLTSFKTAVLARDVLPQQIMLSLGTAICNIAAFTACATAIGFSMPIVASLTLVPVILFSMLIPLSISGWGFREGAAVLIFPLFGATASQGLATSVAFGLVFLVTVLPGLLVIVFRPTAPALGPP